MAAQYGKADPQRKETMRLLIPLACALAALALTGSAAATTGPQHAPSFTVQPIPAAAVSDLEALTNGPNGFCFDSNQGNFGDLWTVFGQPWPYQQKVIEHRVWCAPCLGCKQSYRTSATRLDSLGGVCDHRDPYNLKVSGGNGYTWTNMQSGGHFTCPTNIPGINGNYDNWQQWSCNTWGHCAYVTDSRQ